MDYATLNIQKNGVRLAVVESEGIPFGPQFFYRGSGVVLASDICAAPFIADWGVALGVTLEETHLDTATAQVTADPSTLILYATPN